VLHRLRLGHRASLLPAIHLSQLSEFSLVILVLGVQAGHIHSHSLNVASYAFALTAVISSYAIVKSDSLVRRLGPLLERIGVQDLEPSRAETAFITKPPHGQFPDCRAGTHPPGAVEGCHCRRLQPGG
jgi:hypothetical protein